MTMSKKLRPSVGQNAETMLIEIANQACNLHNGNLRDKTRKTLDHRTNIEPIRTYNFLEGVIPYINQEACLNQWQADKVRGDIIFGRPYDYAYEHDDLKRFENARLMTERMISVINSARHECENCLNADCTMRDPDFPLEEVEQRLEDYSCKQGVTEED
jgi:hypothetical protein